MNYRIFNVDFACDCALAALSPVDTPANVAFSVGETSWKDFSRDGFEVTYEWRDEHSNITSWCERRDQEYFFGVTGHAGFHIDEHCQISCMMFDGGTQEMMHHYLLNQVIPRYLAHLGSLVLHASCMTLTEGRTIAIVGQSGYGKSTLASALHANGARLISDDCIRLEPTSKGVIAHGGIPGFRLYRDSRHHSTANSASFAPFNPYTDKQQHLLWNTPPASAPLAQVYLLNDPQLTPATSISFEPIPAAVAHHQLMHSGFSLDPADEPARLARFEQAADLVESGIPVSALSYPRTLGELNLLAQSIRDHALNSS